MTISMHLPQNAISSDLQIVPSEMGPEDIVAHFDSRISDVVAEFSASELWHTVSDPDTDNSLVREIMKEVYLEISMYQPAVIEATIATIAQMPRTMEVEMFDEMLHHQVEEFDHGEMALRDFVQLGGNEQYARSRRMSPSAFNCAATWRMLCHQREPFAYLGALYPFEGLTPIVSEQVKSVLYQRGFSSQDSEFVEYHSTADLEHTRMVKELIAKVSELYPESKEQMCYGLEYFLGVYPMPVWNAAFHRAKQSLR
ncbi:MAG: iron-containing redox enzyme family protein [Planctomycetota bacterium]